MRHNPLHTLAYVCLAAYAVAASQAALVGTPPGDNESADEYPVDDMEDTPGAAAAALAGGEGYRPPSRLSN